MEGKGWTAARELQVGDKLVTLNNETIIVESVSESSEFETVYNLRVADYHTYFVGTEEWTWSVWAHNLGCMEELAQMAVKGWKKGKGGSHFDKHMREFDFRTVAEYTNAAKAFQWENGPMQIVAKAGNTFFKFCDSTNRLLIVNGKDRVFKTFYRADDGINSFFKAIKDHADVLKSQRGNPIDIVFGWMNRTRQF